MTAKTYKVLRIDAWRDADGGWSWNQWWNVGSVDASVVDMKPRAMLRAMREAGFLSADSCGRIAIDDDGYNIVILARSTLEPLFAIEYGAEG